MTFILEIHYCVAVRSAPNALGVSRVATNKNDSGQEYRSTHAAGQRRLHAVLGGTVAAIHPRQLSRKSRKYVV